MSLFHFAGEAIHWEDMVSPKLKITQPAALTDTTFQLFDRTVLNHSPQSRY